MGGAHGQRFGSCAAGEPPIGARRTTASSPASCRGTGSTATEGVPYKRVAGVDPNLLSLDYHRPTRPRGCGPAPIVVYVHGGGFRFGDRANKVADKVDLFTGEGWVFATVNYRLSPQSPNDRPGQVRYPTHEQDVSAAIAWLADHAATFGGDPSRILLVGHSSGAFLVSLISTDASFLADAGLDTGDVRCTVSLDTEYDVTAQVAQGGSQEILYRNAFGGDPATWSEGSPVEHTASGAPRPRFLIFTRGTSGRRAQARAFASALDRGGTPASVVDVSPLDHEAVNQVVGAADDTEVTPLITAFLRACVQRP